MTRLFSGMALAVLIGWAAVFAYVSADTANFSAGLDPVLWILQIAGAIVFFGVVGFAAWNVWLTWRDGRHWTRKVWSVLILLAASVVLYVAIVYGLMSMTVAY
jgi:hypothetical protein